MQQRKFRIGELARKLQVEPFVVRFWEKEFEIKPRRSDGQQRFYSDKDFTKFLQIKELLYQQGMTIAGAKRQIKTQTAIIPGQKTTVSTLPEEFTQKLSVLKKNLQRIQSLLD